MDARVGVGWGVSVDVLAERREGVGGFRAGPRRDCKVERCRRGTGGEVFVNEPDAYCVAYAAGWVLVVW